MRKPRSMVKRTIVSSLDEIPTHFSSEDEEREWWATHEFSDELYDELQQHASADLRELLASKQVKGKATS